VPARHLTTGVEGERAAASFLVRQGFVILHRNWRCQGLELDLVCEDPATAPPTLVFVEVRTRELMGKTTPAQSLDRGKRCKLSRGASLYLSVHELWSRPCRFDLVSVTRHDTIYEVEHLPNAFEFAGSAGGGDAAWQPW